MQLLLFASFVLLLFHVKHLHAFFACSCSRVPVPVVVVFVICSFVKIKIAYFCRVWALCACVVCVSVRDVWTQHAPRKRANLARFDVWQVFVWEVSLFSCIIQEGEGEVRAAAMMWCKRPNFFWKIFLKNLRITKIY